MELEKVESSVDSLLRSTLKTLFSEEETEELINGISLELDEGGFLYSIMESSDIIGFLVVTPLSDDLDNPDSIDLISIEDIFVKAGKQSKEIAEGLSTEIKAIAKSLGVENTEVIVSQSNSWLNDALVANGYISSEVKLEKLLPRSNNLDDVLELITECTPIDRIVQVLLEKDEQFMAEIVENSIEIRDQLEEGWEPVMVVVTYEPENSDIDQTIEESNQLIKWDDYSIVYYV